MFEIRTLADLFKTSALFSCLLKRQVPLHYSTFHQERSKAAVSAGLDVAVEIKPKHSLIAVQGEFGKLKIPNSLNHMYLWEGMMSYIFSFIKQSYLFSILQ